MFGNNKPRSFGKKLLRGKDFNLLCDVDEYGNIIPESCEPLLGEENIEVESFKPPTPKLPPFQRK